MTDDETIANILRVSREDAMPYLPILHTTSEDLGYIKNIVFKECSIYVWEESKEVLGFIAFTSDWIEHLYLLPKAQSKGIGTALLNEAKIHANSYKLWVFKKNKNAARFYEKNRFQKIKETDGLENEEKEPDILYGWSA